MTQPHGHSASSIAKCERSYSPFKTCMCLCTCLYVSTCAPRGAPKLVYQLTLRYLVGSGEEGRRAISRSRVNTRGTDWFLPCAQKHTHTGVRAKFVRMKLELHVKLQSIMKCCSHFVCVCVDAEWRNVYPQAKNVGVSPVRAASYHQYVGHTRVHTHKDSV